MRVPLPSVVIPAVVLLLYFVVPGLKQQPWAAARIAGVVIAMVGYVLVTLARVQLGKSFTVMPEARELITHGLYSRLRNPIYVFVDVMLFGLVLLFGRPWLFAALAVLVLGQMLQSRREAAVLQAKFGQVYLNYRQQTWF